MQNQKQNQVRKRRKKRPRQAVFNILSIIFIIASFVMLFQVYTEYQNTQRLSEQHELVLQELESLTEQNSELSSQVDKLNDPNYVQNMARGKYMVSKLGENIYHLPSDENLDTGEDESEETTTTTSTYEETTTQNTQDDLPVPESTETTEETTQVSE